MATLTRDELITEVARLVAGLQVPVSMLPREMLGAAYEPWSRLLSVANGGFGWTNAEQCEEAFREVLEEGSDNAHAG